MGVSGPIFSQKNLKGYGTIISILYKMGENIAASLHLLELEPFSYYFVFTKILNLSNVKYILAYIKQYSPSNNDTKGSMEK